jgi:hypothetical protein
MPRRRPIGLTFWPITRPPPLHFAHDDRQVRTASRCGRAAAATGMEALHDDRLADIGLATTRRRRRGSWLFSALAIADLQRLLHVPAMPLARRSARPARLRPSCRGSAAATRFSFCGLTRMCAAPPRLVVREPARCFGLPILLPLRLLVAAVAVIGAGRRELAELVADHVLGHRDRDMLLAVVDAEGQADELRQDGGAARPDLDDLVAARPRATLSRPSSAGSRRRTGLSRLNGVIRYPFFLRCGASA